MVTPRKTVEQAGAQLCQAQDKSFNSIGPKACVFNLWRRLQAYWARWFEMANPTAELKQG